MDNFMNIDVEELEDKYTDTPENFKERTQRHAKRFSKQVYGNYKDRKYGKPKRSSGHDF